jgi:hypothetical protein
MSSKFAYKDILAAFRDRTNEHEEFLTALDKNKSEIQQYLAGAESCVIVGAGTGDREIEFIIHVMPKLRSLIAIEPDADMAAELRQRTKTRLQHVETTIHQEKVENWKGVDKKVDVVLLFHILYYFSESDRCQLVRKLRDDVVVRDGHVVTLLSLETEGDKSDELNGLSITTRLNGGLKSKFPAVGEVERMMIDAGFPLLFEIIFENRMKMNDVDNDEKFLDMCVMMTTATVSRQDVLRVIHDLLGDRNEFKIVNKLTIYHNHGIKQ